MASTWYDHGKSTGQSVQGRDLLDWSGSLVKEMTAEIQVRDVASVEAFRTRHKEIRAVMDTRNPELDLAIDRGKEMVDAEHIQAVEVKETFFWFKLRYTVGMYISSMSYHFFLKCNTWPVWAKHIFFH